MNLFYLHIGMLYERAFPYNPNVHLWLLRPRRDVLSRPENPWTPTFDKVLGLVVRAQDELAARALAQANAGHEGLGVYRELGLSEDELASDVWLDPAWTSCDELEIEGASTVILVDKREG
jgi:hypothetical protein